MKAFSKKKIIYTILIMLIGVVINRGISELAALVGLPLYLDCIGTMIVAVLSGTFPGMMVGFISNMIGGIYDSSTFYYGTVNVLIAYIASKGAEKGCFDKPLGLLKLIPFFMILSIPCSFLTYILFEFQIGENVASGVVGKLHDLGIPILLSQILGDYCIEIPDKILSLAITFIVIKIIPVKVKHIFAGLAGRELRKNKTDKFDNVSSLRNQLAVGMFITGFLIVLVAFLISYKTYMEARVSGYPDGNYNIYLLRTETLLYSSKMLSAVLGLLLCIVSFAMVYADFVYVSPLNKMAKEMGRFAYDSDSGRDKSVAKIESLNIKTGNEIEELYNAISKTVRDIDEYIDKTNEQAETISKLHVNIITTLADIVESRDETTGYHVKRTAVYSELLAKKLQSREKYKDIISDDFIDTITIAAPLHDIGKIRIPDAILNKPGRLTDEEFEVIKTHPTLGKAMLENTNIKLGGTDYLKMAADIAYYHHEWWDGSRGYPTKIKGEEIPLSARIMAVADVLDALLSKRPYKDGYSIDKAYEIMLEEKGTHFDPDIIDALLEIKDEVIRVAEKYAD